MSVTYEDFPPPGIGNVNGLGVAGRVAFWSAADTLSSSANFLWDSAASKLTVTGGLTSDRTVNLVYSIANLNLNALWAGTYGDMTITQTSSAVGKEAFHNIYFSTIAGTHDFSSFAGIGNFITKTNTSTLTSLKGINNQVNHSAGIVTTLEGLRSVLSITGGTITNAVGLTLVCNTAGAGAITSYKPLSLSAPGAGVVSSLGLHAEDQGLTNYYLHSLGGKNLLSGPLDLMTTIATSQLAFQTFSLSTLTQPNSSYDTTNYGVLEVSGGDGGLSITGLSDADKTGLFLTGLVGSAVTTRVAVMVIGAKSDGAGGQQAIGDAEKLFEVNNDGTPAVDIYGNGDIQLVGGKLGVGMVPVRKLDVKGVANTAGAGTVSNAGTTVTGVGTAFLTDFVAGDYIIANAVQIRIVSVTNDTTLTLDTAPAAAWVGLAYSIVKPISRYIDSGATTNASVYPTGDFNVASIVTSGARPSVMSLGVGAVPKLSFGFTDSTTFHQIRTAGGANLDLMFDVRDGTNHFFGVNGLFKTAYSAVIGDSTFANSAPTNGLLVKGRMSGSLGASVVAANDLTLGSDGNAFFITGNTQINAITTSNWKLSSEITLIFTGTPTIKHNTAGGAGTAKIKLDGETDLAAANGMILVLVYDGTDFRQKCPPSYTGA